MLSYSEKMCVVSFACRTSLCALQDRAAWEHVEVTEKSDIEDFMSRAGSAVDGFFQTRGLRLVCEAVDVSGSKSGQRNAALHIPIVLSEWTTAAQVQALIGHELAVDTDNLLGKRPFAASKVSNRLVLIER